MSTPLTVTPELGLAAIRAFAITSELALAVTDLRQIPQEERGSRDRQRARITKVQQRLADARVNMAAHLAEAIVYGCSSRVRLSAFVVRNIGHQRMLIGDRGTRYGQCVYTSESIWNEVLASDVSLDPHRQLHVAEESEWLLLQGLLLLIVEGAEPEAVANLTLTINGVPAC